MRRDNKGLNRCLKNSRCKRWNGALLWGLSLQVWQVMWQRYKAKKHQMYIYWWDDAPEPDRYMYTLFNSKSRDYYYKNTTIDKLLDLGRTILNREKRAKVYNKIDRILYEDCPWVYLYVVPEVFGVADRVDYKGNRDGILNVWTAKAKQ